MPVFLRKAGVGLLLAGCGTSTSNVPAQRQSQASVSQQVGIDTPGVPGAQCTLSSVTVNRTRTFVGFDAKLAFATFTAEAEKSGDTTTISSKIGFRFREEET